MNLQELQLQVVQWAQYRGLLTDVTPERIEKQTLKVLEEIGETAGAYLKGNRPDLIDGIGDVAVTLIILMAMKDASIDLKREVNDDEANLLFIAESLVDFHRHETLDELSYAFGLLRVFAFNNDLFIADCLQSAYDVISKRKGKMIGDTFIKD